MGEISNSALCLRKQLAAEGILFSGSPCVCPYTKSLLTLCFTNRLWGNFYQIYNLDAVGNENDLIRF